MTKRPVFKTSDAVTMDLQAYSRTLTGLLPVLLFSRDRDALTRWSTVRSWIDNGLAGDASPDLATIDLAIAYLAERGTDAHQNDA